MSLVKEAIVAKLRKYWHAMRGRVSQGPHMGKKIGDLKALEKKLTRGHTALLEKTDKLDEVAGKLDLAMRKTPSRFKKARRRLGKKLRKQVAKVQRNVDKMTKEFGNPRSDISSAIEATPKRTFKARMGTGLAVGLPVAGYLSSKILSKKNKK